MTPTAKSDDASAVEPNDIIVWLDRMAAGVSNLGKPRSDNEFGRVATEIETLRERVAELKKRVGGLCSYPLCDCKSDECLVLDGPIPEQEWRTELLARAEAAEARGVELARALEKWGEPANHRDSKWWQNWEANRLVVLAVTPAEALERAKAVEEIVKAARVVAEASNYLHRDGELRSAFTKLDALGKEE